MANAAHEAHREENERLQRENTKLSMRVLRLEAENSLLKPEHGPKLPEGITAEFPVWPISLSPQGVEVFLVDAMGMSTAAQIKEQHHQDPTACTLLALTLAEYVHATSKEGEDSLRANEALERLRAYSGALLAQRQKRQQQKKSETLGELAVQLPLFGDKSWKIKSPAP